MPSVFLFAPQDFHNVCLMARTLEAFGERECAIYDPHRLVRDHYGKVRARELRAVSAGAFEKMKWLRVEEPERFLSEHRGRVVATVLDARAIPLTVHRFQRTDLTVFGSERGGLPASVVAMSSAAVTIPLRGVTQSLNLAVSVGVFLFERQRQLESSG